MASYFPEAENFNGSDTDMCSDVAGSSSSGSGDLFELLDRSNIPYFYSFPLIALLATILDVSVTTIPILLFGASYVIMHKVYCRCSSRSHATHNFVVLSLCLAKDDREMYKDL